ncbi:hypothetical protein DPMN_125898 [Dreissena polymorpha]|uniref:Uncharacterized protein n=1 Tax=Dreissena polymorpha TaxID=45954 RepID=A0A9D4GYK0_DREPO|nr:hypothetical protein DPMN_125898 [Dreissena polymorpha]
MRPVCVGACCLVKWGALLIFPGTACLVGLVRFRTGCLVAMRQATTPGCEWLLRCSGTCYKCWLRMATRLIRKLLLGCLKTSYYV